MAMIEASSYIAVATATGILNCLRLQPEQLSPSTANVRFVNTLPMFRFRNATDPRNKVYGILGLMLEVQFATIQLNHNLPVVKISAHTSLRLIEETRPLTILSYIHGLGVSRFGPHEFKNFP
ncbi:hypothetical protein K432DRAFT_194786 [Lepidopterella palustris CBS 459.81]|uniref:Uncharacterized protein n=1 Tax=Lepidopterella palustris CBS 459.81 TaxID=1314670 RepID=A0A8E2DZH7_9PEZI|nr:hypothetical protein K432DRAFT_194786 [Lepidopterella palustris CBS 459.81]